MLGNTHTSLRSRLAALLVTAVLLLAGLPFTSAFAALPFDLPGVEAGQHDDIRGVYSYVDVDALGKVPKPVDLDKIPIGDAKQWKSLTFGTKEHLEARWKAHVVEKEANNWEAWRDIYLAENPKNAETLRALAALSDADLGDLKPSKVYQAGTPERVYAKWRDTVVKRRKPTWTPPNWDSWLKGFVRLHNSRLKGGQGGFEGFFKKKFFDEGGLSAEEYRFNQQVPPDVKAKLPADMTKFDRPLDIARFTAEGVILELKSGSELGQEQWEQLADLLKIAKVTGVDLVYVFGTQPDQATIDKIKEMASEAGVTIWVRFFHAVAVKASEQAATDGARAGPGLLTPPQQHAVPSPLLDALDAAPDSAEEAAEQASIRQSLIEADPELEEAQPEANLGGVDFSALELRYVSSTFHNGPSAQYAYKAGTLSEGQESFGGRRAAKLASDSFFVWLSLTPEKFWVNLNPDEPDRIIDEKFGRTDAGRVLLEADLAMKKSVAKFVHPDALAGKRFWEALRGEAKCVSMRQWIVPAAATVRDTGDELFILNTPLQVKMETEYRKSAEPAREACDSQDSLTTQHNEQVYRRMILPQVQEAVNTAPEYANLRRVYASRVAAEWYRQRSLLKRTPYSDLVNQGDISRWESTEKWTPREVFDRYVRSYREGEFNITRTTTQGDWVSTNTFIYGGVNFEQVDQRPVDAARFDREHPNLSAAAKNALYSRVTGDRALWAGALTTTRPPAEAFRIPRPATGMPLFYGLAAAPLAGWLVVGLWLSMRRRKGREVSA